jgi:hypothetical protein
MSHNAIFVLMFLFFTKHFIVDFPLQTPFQWMNKGTYGHLGGILHSVLHGAATILILLFFTDPVTAAALGAADSFVHYHIDWAKMNINKKMGWAANTHAEFWTLMGLDQWLHALTYILIAASV